MDTSRAYGAKGGGGGVVRGSLFEEVATPVGGERFDRLGAVGGVRIERIVSSDRPEDGIYDQAHDEWVLLVRGEATLEIAGVSATLHEGEYLFIPRHTPHRVLTTRAGSIWLALHADLELG